MKKKKKKKRENSPSDWYDDMCSDRGRGHGGREGSKKERKRTQQMEARLAGYQDQNGVCIFFRIQELIHQGGCRCMRKGCYQMIACLQTGKCYTSSTVSLYCGCEWLNITKSYFLLGLSRAKAPLLAEYTISCLNKTLPLATSEIRTF